MVIWSTGDSSFACPEFIPPYFDNSILVPFHFIFSLKTVIFQRCVWAPSQANIIQDQNFAGTTLKESQPLGICQGGGNMNLEPLVTILTSQQESLHKRIANIEKEEVRDDRFLAPLFRHFAPTHMKPTSGLFRYMNQIIISLSQFNLCFCHSQPVKSFLVHLLPCCELC